MSQQNVYQADQESAQVIQNVYQKAYQACKQYAHEYVRIQTLDGNSYDGVIVGIDGDNVYMEIEEDQPDFTPVNHRSFRCTPKITPPPYPIYPPFPPYPPYPVYEPPYPVYEPPLPVYEPPLPPPLPTFDTTYEAPRRRRRRRILPLSLFTLLSIVLLKR